MKKSTKSRILRMLPITIVLIIIIGLFSMSFIFDLNSSTMKLKDYQYQGLDVVCDVKEDGTAMVKETWLINGKKYNSSSFHNGFGKSEDDFWYDGDDITIISAFVDGVPCEYVEVTTSQKDKSLPNNTFYQYDTSEKTEWGVFFEQKRKTMEIVFEYEIKNFVIGYLDTALFELNFFGGGNAKFPSITATFNLPIEAEACWVHYGDAGKIKNTTINMDNRKSVVFTFEEHNGDSYLSSRFLLPVTAFKDLAREEYGYVREVIYEQEEEKAKVYERAIQTAKAKAEAEEIEKQTRRKTDFTLMGIIIVIFVIAVVILVVVLKNKKYKVPKYEYYRDIIKGVDTANIGFLYYASKGGLKSNINLGNTISGTILDFIVRGILIDQGDGNYKINSEIDRKKDLTGAERHLLDILNEVAETYGEDDIFKIEEIDKLMDDVTQRHFLEDELNRYEVYAGQIDNIRLDEKRLKMRKNIMYLGVPFIMLASFLGFVFKLTYTAISMVSVGALWIAIAFLIPIGLTPRGEALRQEILGMERYLKDFSLMDERDLPELELWEHYMVYATIMEIPIKVMDKMEVKYPKIFEGNRIMSRLIEICSYLK